MSARNISPKTRLRGEFTVPGDKSISHRSIMLGSIALGATEITNFLEGADCLSTMKCFQDMGVEIVRKPQSILIHGKGIRGLSKPSSVLDVGNSGTTTRLLAGILSGQNFTSILSGDASLNTRPMDRIIVPLRSMGAQIKSVHDNHCAPLKIEPGNIHGISYQSPVASAQVKSAVLLAGLYAKNSTSVMEPALSRNHTELMLQSFGASVSVTVHPGGSATASLEPCSELYGQQVDVPGDISSAAYLIAAGLLVPDSELLIKNVGVNFTRAGFLEVCRQMGGDITYLNQSFQGGEARADLLVKTSRLCGTTIEGSLIPTLIDEIPIIAVMASLSEGATIIKDASELRVKETNRINTVTRNLQAMGALVTPTRDGLIIEGRERLSGARLESYHDHRIAMAFAVAGLAANGESTLENSECVEISYPNFWGTGLF